MDHCQDIWSHQHDEIQITAQDWNHCSWILSQASPSLMRVLQVIKFIQLPPEDPLALLKIHFLLDFSWNKLRTVICSLRPLIGDKGDGLLKKLLIVALDPTLFPVLFNSIMRDLACGSLRVMQQILRGKLDENVE
jgi:hypothetical protein